MRLVPYVRLYLMATGGGVLGAAMGGPLLVLMGKADRIETPLIVNVAGAALGVVALVGCRYFCDESRHPLSIAATLSAAVLAAYIALPMLGLGIGWAAFGLAFIVAAVCSVLVAAACLRQRSRNAAPSAER